MKWIAILAVAVVLLIGIWLLVGPGEPSAPERTLEIPAAAAGKPALIKAAQQFLSVDLHSVRPQDAAELLRAVVRGLDDQDWPQVQKAAFIGWHLVHLRMEVREILAPDQELLMTRLAQFGTIDDLGALIEVANKDANWKPQIDAILLRLVSKEVPAAAPEKSQVIPLLRAAVAKRDFDRVSLYVTKARFEAGVPEAVKEPVFRLEQALRLHFEARDQKPAMAAIVKLWGVDSADALCAPLLLNIGIELAKSGQASLDFSKLKQAIADSKSEARSKDYWERAMAAYGETAPERGAYLEAPSLEAMSRAVGEGFENRTVEVAFWKSLAAKTPADSTGEGMWRVECLKKAYRATPNPTEKLALLKEIGQGYKTHMPGAAHASVGVLAAELPEDTSKPDVDAILTDARKTTAAHEAGRQKLQRELAQLPTRTTADMLKRQLADLKGHKGNPDVIANMEKQIKELEKKLTE